MTLREDTTLLELMQDAKERTESREVKESALLMSGAAQRLEEMTSASEDQSIHSAAEQAGKVLLHTLEVLATLKLDPAGCLVLAKGLLDGSQSPSMLPVR